MIDDKGPPTDRFCDLVMKGGIASGVVYPKAIAELSNHYCFQSIGGTSAGAIAAAVTAAAEYQRRHTGSRAGFELLEKLPKELGTELAHNTSRLLSLFQPQPPLRRLFSVLIQALNRKKTSSRVVHIILGFMKAYWPATLVSTLVAVVIGALGLGWFAALLSLLVTLPLLVGYWVYLDITRQLVSHDLGLCTGLTVDKRHEALTPWLHSLIQAAAGRSLGDDPLTFGDLWSAPGLSPSASDGVNDPELRSIDLQMFSTNLSHGRPYIFPLSPPSSQSTKYRDRERLYFTENEMSRCLPLDVVAWMIKKSEPYTLEQGREGKDPSTNDAIAMGIRELPKAKDFPVLLAARMSLSFPFLFTAVPLHAIDHEMPNNRKFRRCWFSDGGISSNFPIHLFDDLLPMWPTFGLSLEPKIHGRNMVFLPEQYDQGYGERWNHMPEEKKGGAKTLGWFIGALIGTMQNWNDNSLSRMPGVRDRVARVRLEKDEGGMNLNMKPEHITTVADRGVVAIQELRARFAQPPRNGGRINGWDEHRFVRLNVLLKMLAARSPGIAAAVSPNCAHATDFSTLLTKMKEASTANGRPLPPPGYEQPMTDQQYKELQAFVDNLKKLATAMTNQGGSIPFKPIPIPELRVRPPL